MWNGKPVPRVSQIIEKIIGWEETNGGIEQWKKNTPNWQDLTNWGILMHLTILSRYSRVPIEVENKIPLYSLPKDTWEELKGREEQWDKLGMEIGEPAMVEHRLYHVEPGEECGGTSDLAAPIDKKKTILDLKSTKRPLEKHVIQVGAYYLGLKRIGWEAERGIVTYLRRDNSEVIEIEKPDLVEASEAFRDAARKYHEKYTTD